MLLVLCVTKFLRCAKRMFVFTNRVIKKYDNFTRTFNVKLSYINEYILYSIHNTFLVFNERH